MRRTSAILAVLAFALTASARAHYTLPESHSCPGIVVLKPGTDFVAFDFRVRNLGCRKARRVGRRFARGDRTPFGFRCVSRPRQDGDRRNAQAHTDARCVRRGHATVFVVT